MVGAPHSRQWGEYLRRPSIVGAPTSLLRRFAWVRGVIHPFLPVMISTARSAIGAIELVHVGRVSARVWVRGGYAADSGSGFGEVVGSEDV